MSMKSGSAAPAYNSVLPGALVCPPPDGAEFAQETRSLRRADALIASGQMDKAVATLRRLTRRLPGATRAHLKMATLLKGARRVGEAMTVLRRATFAAPGDPAPLEALAELALETGATDEAITLGRRLLTLSPRSLLARDVLSAAFLQRGLLSDALHMAEELARLDPEEPAHHFKRGVLLQQMGQIGAATEAYLRCLDGSDASGDDTYLSEAHEAVEILDRFQLRQIALLAVEDVLFRANLLRDPFGTAFGKGFRLSPAGIAALARLTPEDLPAGNPPWRHRYYH